MVSRFNHERKSCKVAECFRQVFEGTSLDMKGFGLGWVVYILYVDYRKRNF